MSQMSAALTAKGPLHYLSEGLRQRLQVGFPPAYFDFAWMPAKADRAWFKQACRRTAMVAISWNGTNATNDSGYVFGGTAHFTVALVVKNSNIEGRYTGDALAPGLFAMARVAAVLLQGYLINPDDNPFTATGTVQISAMGNPYNEEWGDENAAICAIDIAVPYEETPPPELDTSSAEALQTVIEWNFGQPQLVADQTGGA